MTCVFCISNVVLFTLPTTGSGKGRGNQYIQFVMVLYCKCRPTASNHQLSHLRPHRPQRWEPRVLPLYHHGPPGDNVKTAVKNNPKGEGVEKFQNSKAFFYGTVIYVMDMIFT